MIRIIAGRYRGRKIHVPDAPGLRPTTDRTKAAMFNLFTHRLSASMENMHVLDGFAGSGALGFECLSRGARSTTLVEGNRLVVKQLRRLADTFEETSRVIHADFYQFLASHDRPFDLILLDPPFNETDYNELLKRLAASRCVKPETMLVLEHPSEIVLSMPREFAVEVDRAYGRSSIVVAVHRKDSHENRTLPRNI